MSEGGRIPDDLLYDEHGDVRFLPSPNPPSAVMRRRAKPIEIPPPARRVAQVPDTTPDGRTMRPEERLKAAVRMLINNGVYPGPTRINEALGRSYTRMNSIGSKECQWRREICAELGFTLHGTNLGDE